MTVLPMKKKLYIAAGTFFLGLGIIGMFVPLMPSTVFLLLAAAAYARGSDRFYHWLINHRWFGGIIRDYRSGLGIPLKQKLTTMILLWSTIGASGYFFVHIIWVKFLLVLIAIGVSIHLISLKTKSETTVKTKTIEPSISSPE